MFRRARSSPRWTFWMLIAAWVCANTPQIALLTLLTWVGDARSFAHQKKLSLEVAGLLTGQVETSAVDAAPNVPPPSSPPVVPSDILAKKLVLALEQTSENLPSAPRILAQITEPFPWLEQSRRAPPHEPPRRVRS